MNQNQKITIMNMAALTDQQLEEGALLLTGSLPKGWPTVEEARREIAQRLIPENTLLAALENGRVIGWGGILAPVYNGNVFELHPFGVKKEYRNQGVGRQLLLALEKAARNQGGMTIYLGSDDEQEPGETSLAGEDLYENLPEKLRNFKPGTHAAGFYLKMGYTLVGVLPNANGKGKPDLFFAKNLGD